MARPSTLTQIVQMQIVLIERDKQVRREVRDRILAKMAACDVLSRQEMVKIVEEAARG